MNVYITGDGASASAEFPTFNTRPIDKKLKVVSYTLMADGVADSTVLHTADFPSTVVGLRWAIAIYNQEPNRFPLFHWIIVVVPDGRTVNTMSINDGDDFYTPEQDVIAFGVVRLSENDSSENPNSTYFEGTVKTARKLKAGDTLVLSVLMTRGVASTDVFWDSVIQFFIKT